MLFKRNSHKYNDVQVESKWKGNEILHKQINVGVTILISDKVDFIKKFTRDRKRHYIVMKGSTHRKDRAILNVSAPNNRAGK